MESTAEPDAKVALDTQAAGETGPGLADLIAHYLDPNLPLSTSHEGEITVLPSPHPYPGLRSFRRSERAFFFSRDRQVDDLLKRLEASSVVMVLGGSGSGKSSLLRAGLLPRMTGLDPMPRRSGAWYTAASRPETSPLTRLAEALWNDVFVTAMDLPSTRPVLVERLGLSNAGIAEDKESVSRHAVAKIREWLKPGKDQGSTGTWGLSRIQQELLALELNAMGVAIAAQPNLLVVIDQFEEIFREGVDLEERALLLDIIRAIHEQDTSGSIRLILVMRSEDTHRCAQESLLANLLNESPYYVRWLSPQELHRAIVSPAREVFAGWGVPIGTESSAPFDRDLIKQLLSEVRQLRRAPETSADHLPLLAHALEAIWDRGLRRMGQVKANDSPLFELSDLVGGSLIECLQQRAANSLSKAERAYYTTLNETRSAGTSSSKQSLPSAQMALRSAFCELTSLDENRRIYRAFRQPLAIAAGRFDSTDPRLVRGIETALQSLEDDGYLNRTNSGFDVSHEALPRNWKPCEEWLRSDTSAATLLMDVATKNAELSLSDATEIDRLLHKTFSWHAISWLRAAVADMLLLQTGDPAGSTSRAQNVVDNAKRLLLRFRHKQRLQRGLWASAAMLVLLVMALGSVLVTMAVGARQVGSVWIASQYAGPAIPTVDKASELAAVKAMLDPNDQLSQTEMAVAHWVARWIAVVIPSLKLSEEVQAWYMLDQAERQVFGAVYSVRDDKQSYKAEQPTCGTAASRTVQVGDVQINWQDKSFNIVKSGNTIPLVDAPDIDTSNLKTACLSSDANLLVTMSQKSAFPRLFQLAWMKLCPSGVPLGSCSHREHVKVTEIKREDKPLTPTSGLTQDLDADILSISQVLATGRREIRFGNSKKILVAKFYEGLARPVRVTQHESVPNSSDFTCLADEMEKNSAERDPHPCWPSSLSLRVTSPISIPPDFSGIPYTIRAFQIRSIGSPAGYQEFYQIFQVARDADVNRSTVESWSFEGPPIVSVAQNGHEYLTMLDEAGDYWRVMLHVARRNEILGDEASATVIPDYRWSIPCQVIGCNLLLQPAR